MVESGHDMTPVMSSEREKERLMKTFFASAGVALVALTVAVPSGTMAGQKGMRLVESNAICLDRLDWDWVVKNNRGRNWAASTKDEKSESPRFAGPCARMTLPAGSPNYGYRGRATGTHYLFKFPK